MKIPNLDLASGELTQEFLQNIARRIKHIDIPPWTVTITEDSITCDPNFYTYANYRGREHDDTITKEKMNVTDFVLNYQMKGLKVSDLVPGVYYYAHPIDGVRRRWKKIG